MKTDIQPITDLPIAAIEPSPTNPRKRFDEQKLAQLADTIVAQGVLQRLLVRPWPGRPGVYECVDGERRLRAAQAIGKTLVPVDVREMTDAEVIAVQLVTGETGEPLSPIEEAEGLKRALEVKDDDGKTMSVDRLAERLGCTARSIRNKLTLLRLPAEASKLIENGDLPSRTAQLVARIPDELDMQAAIKAIMPCGDRAEPLSFVAAEQLIRERWTVRLNGAPFRVDDAELIGPDGAPRACTSCPYIETSGKNSVCTKPSCFRAKCAAVHSRADEAARAAGRTVLSEEQASAYVFDPMSSDPVLRPDSPYVDLNAKPSYRHVSSAVEDKNLPTWKKLIEGADEKGIKVPIFEARHLATGRRLELVKLEHAIEAAKKVGEDIFRKDTVAQVVRQTDKYTANSKKETETAKRRITESAAGLALLHQRIADRPQSDPELTKALLEVALHHAGPDGRGLVIKAFSIVPETNQSDVAALTSWFAKTGGAEALALVPVLLVSHDMKWNGLKAAGFAALAELVELTAEEIAEAIEPKKPARKVKAKPTAEEQASTIRALAAQGKQVTAIYLETHIPRRTVQRVLKQIDAEKGRAA